MRHTHGTNGDQAAGHDAPMDRGRIAGALHRREFLATGGAAVVAAALPSTAGAATRERGHDARARGEAPVRVQRLSWAGVRLETAQRTLLIDPWVTASIWNGAWTTPVIPIEVSTPNRSVLITHLHNDHFDPDAVRAALQDRGSVVCHADVAPQVVARGFRVIPARHFEPIILGDFVATAVPASDGVGAFQVSWVVEGHGMKFFHGGDTVWHGELRRIGRAYGPFDAAFVPINGARVLAIEPQPDVPMSMPPDHAAGAAALLRARVAVPMHYGLHDPKAYLEHPDAEASFLAAARARGVSVELVPEGGWLGGRSGTGR